MGHYGSEKYCIVEGWAHHAPVILGNRSCLSHRLHWQSRSSRFLARGCGNAATLMETRTGAHPMASPHTRKPAHETTSQYRSTPASQPDTQQGLPEAAAFIQRPQVRPSQAHVWLAEKSREDILLRAGHRNGCRKIGVTAAPLHGATDTAARTLVMPLRPYTEPQIRMPETWSHRCVLPRSRRNDSQKICDSCALGKRHGNGFEKIGDTAAPIHGAAETAARKLAIPLRPYTEPQERLPENWR